MALKRWEVVDTNTQNRMQTNALKIYKWLGISEGDTCLFVELPDHKDKTIQVFGTFGGATITPEGSMDDNEGSEEFFDLKDPNDNALAFTLAGGNTILENVWKFRPKITNGSGSSINVYLLAG